MSIVVPAALTPSHAELEAELELFAKVPSVSRVQIDVVDGHFASPASWPYSAPNEFVAMVERHETLPNLDRIQYEIDLMCLDALGAVEGWLTLGASRFTFHAESTRDLPRLLASARKQYGEGLTAGLASFGVALNIASDMGVLEPCVALMSYVQFMGIARIGKQGQPFDRRVFEKVRVFHSRHPTIPVQVDGGVSLEHATELVALGVSSLVIGSAILRAGDPASAVAAFEAVKTPYGV